MASSLSTIQDNEDEEELLEAAEAAAANGLHTSDTLAKSQAKICTKYRKHSKCYLPLIGMSYESKKKAHLSAT